MGWEGLAPPNPLIPNVVEFKSSWYKTVRGNWASPNLSSSWGSVTSPVMVLFVAHRSAA